MRKLVIWHFLVAIVMANVKCNFLKYISLSLVTLVFPLFYCCISVRTDNLDKSRHTALQHVVNKYSRSASIEVIKHWTLIKLAYSNLVRFSVCTALLPLLFTWIFSSYPCKWQLQNPCMMFVGLKFTRILSSYFFYHKISANWHKHEQGIITFNKLTQVVRCKISVKWQKKRDTKSLCKLTQVGHCKIYVKWRGSIWKGEIKPKKIDSTREV